MRVLLRDGFGGTRVSEIAREAGIQAGSIYNHFPSKADLLMAAITAHAPSVIGDLLQGRGDVSVLEAFRQVANELGDPSGQDIAPVMLELLATAGRDRDVAAVVGRAFSENATEISDVIRLAQDHGEIDRTLDAEALARFVNMVAMGSLTFAALDSKPIDREAWAAVVDRMLDAARPATRART